MSVTRNEAITTGKLLVWYHGGNRFRSEERANAPMVHTALKSLGFQDPDDRKMIITEARHQAIRVRQFLGVRVTT